MKTFLLAFDSFKGSLTSAEVADAFEEGLRSVLPNCNVRKAYLADGGEGTAAALVNTLHGKWIETEVADPLMRPIRARYGVIDDGGTAVIEMAAASGLTLLSPEERNPLKTSTYGTGQLMADALSRGCRKLLIGIGGSATNDAGTGMLSALGVRFLDAGGNRLEGCGASLERIASIDTSHLLPSLASCQISVACDVTNPFSGPKGAAHVFAPQKGADPQMVECLDKGLVHFAGIIKLYSQVDVNTIPGAGAAGGLGGAFSALLNASLRRGVEMILDALHFDELLKGCDFVITGEGRIDRQTLMGKAAMGVLETASRQGIPVIAIGGSVEDCTELEDSGFYSIFSINEGAEIPLSLAMRPDIAKEHVRRAGVKFGTTFCSTYTPDSSL
ncbi:MAG: glycerate kinase [Bacteroidaceae bacterium]|nr:glycerate kinase [Bacteroidaceae bacterium]